MLRDYQKEAADTAIENLDDSPLLVLPTAAGKSFVIAELINRLKLKTLVIQPGKEILEQNYSKLENYTDNSEILANMGVYSASLNRKEVKDITFATIGSVFKDPKMFDFVQLIIVDEAHETSERIGRRHSMFKKLVKELDAKIVGLTATPCRAKQYQNPNGYGNYTVNKYLDSYKIFNTKFVVNIKELISGGYIKGVDGYWKIKDVRRVQKICKHPERKKILVFAESVQQAWRLSEETENSAFISSDTKKKERAKILKDFTEGDLKVIFNVSVLTTGFDFDKLDTIIMMRDTKSLALYIQIIGRVLRCCEGGKVSRVFDMADNIERFGKVETMYVENGEIYSERGRLTGVDIDTKKVSATRW